MRWTLASGGTGQARWVNLDYAVASKAIARFEQRMRTDPRLCEQLAGVQQQLSNRQMTRYDPSSYRARLKCRSRVTIQGISTGPDPVRVGHQLPVDVAGHDGGNDAAVRAADVSKNTAAMGFPLLHGVWILRHLAGSRCWNSFARRCVGDGFDAIGIDKSCRSLALGRIVDRRRSLSIHTLENDAPVALPLAIGMRRVMPPK